MGDGLALAPRKSRKMRVNKQDGVTCSFLLSFQTGDNMAGTKSWLDGIGSNPPSALDGSVHLTASLSTLRKKNNALWLLQSLKEIRDPNVRM